MNVKLAVAQLNPTVGDLDGNAALLLGAYAEAARAGADLVVAPECALTGYPLEDLVSRESFMAAVMARIAEVAAAVRATGGGPGLVFGAPHRDPARDRPTNSAFLVDPSDPAADIARADKVELPNYGVFDERRVFAPGGPPRALPWRGRRLGLMICEDCWFPDVARALADDGAELLIAVNGSPFEVGKNVVRRRIVAERVMETGRPFLYVNLVGGQDELVFDGGSFLYDGTLQAAPDFRAGLTHMAAVLTPAPVTLDAYPAETPSGEAAIYRACVLGLRDYLRKGGFASAVLGYSGGVDSGLVAALACDAIGPDAVELVRLPSRFSSAGSLTDAATGAARLGARLRTIPIEGVVEALRQAYASAAHDDPHASGQPAAARLAGVADENVQARARGALLMAISNQEGPILLTTGNKSEMSVGYSTL